jgi:1-deoxy-D-xylulose 5-phosphate reductoisomerase
LKHIAILGSTGSIGQSTLSIIESYPERFSVASVAAGRNVDAAFEQCRRWRPSVVSMATEELAGQLRSKLKKARMSETEIVWGVAGTVAVATVPAVDFVVSAIVGVAGLEATYAAVKAGKAVGLANKEAMVAAGEILTRAAAHRLRAQRDSPVHARRKAGRGAAHLVDCLGRPISDAATGEIFRDYCRAGAQTSDVEHGTPDYD